MNRRLRLIVTPGALVLAGVTALACGRVDRAPVGPPATATLTVADTVGGIVVEDPYRWLENDASDTVREWVAAQNAWTDAVIGGMPERPAVLRRIVELLRVETATQPIVRGDRYFFMKRSADLDRFAIYLREGPDGVDRRLIDPYTFSDSMPPELALLGVTPDGGVVTYSVRRAGAEEAVIGFFDVERRADLGRRLPPGRYTSVDMLADRSGVYYARLEPAGPRLWFRSLTAPLAADSIVFGKALGPDRVIGSAVSANGHWLGMVVFRGNDGATSDVHVADLQNGGRLRPIVEGVGARFLPAFAGDTLLLHTDWNAPNGRILGVPLADPRRVRWVEIVPEHESAIIEGVSAAGGRLLVNTLEDAYSHLDVYGIDGNHLGAIDLPYPGSVSAITGAWDQSEAFLTFETFHVPPTIERYDVTSGQLSPWFEPPVPIPAGLTVRQEWIASADGTRVPLFLVHREGLVRNGRHAAVLTGFGGFGASLTPSFVVEAVLIAERAGVFAVVNARGGGEFGDAWHRAGRREHKHRAIEDFLAAADWLIESDYSSVGRLGAWGATHGGLLAAAAMTRRPGLFGAVAAQFPLLDMARLTAGGSGSSWIDEYGSPSDPAELATLLDYSPYHTVDSTGELPPVLLAAARSSPVPPFHARKMIARLQSGSAPAGRFLLREDTATSAGPARTGSVQDLADLLTFLLTNTQPDTTATLRS